MITNHDDAEDLAAFRARREERERRPEARETLPRDAVNYGRVIPPPLNPDVHRMVKKVKDCYLALIRWVVGFQGEIVELVNAGKLDPVEQRSLLEHYCDLHTAVEAATLAMPKGDPGARANDFAEDGDWNRSAVDRFADHAKHVYAVGARDIASLQYGLAELAHTGRLDFEAHERLQWYHCLPMWETLYHGTTCAVRDESTWDGAWDWYDATYSDGRQVMVQARIKNWMELDRDWPYNAGMCGDGPILEHPRGSLCQIFPVVDPYDGYCYYPSMEMDLEGVIEQLGPPPTGLGTKAESGVGGQ